MRQSKTIFEQYLSEFESIFIICILWGSILTRRSHGPKALLVSFTLFVVAFIVQTLLFGRRHLGVDLENKETKVEKIQIYLMGSEEASQVENEEEKSLYEHLGRFRKLIKFVNYCLFGLFIYLSHHFQVPIFEVPMLLFVLLCLVFSQVASLFQYLVPLGLSGISVIYFQSKNDKALDWFGIIYLCLFIATLVLHRRASGSQSFKIPFLREAQTDFTGQMKYALRATLCFLGLFFILDYVVPTLKPKPADPLVGLAKGVARGFSGTPTLNKPLGDSGQGTRKPATSSVNPETLKALSRRISDNQALLEKLKGLSSTGGNGDISELLKKLGSGGELSENEKKSLADWAQKNMANGGQPIGPQLGGSQSDGPQSQVDPQSLKDFADRFSRDRKGLEKIENELKQDSSLGNLSQAEQSGSGSLEKITNEQALETIQRIKGNQETTDSDFKILDRALSNAKKEADPASQLKAKFEEEKQRELISERNIERLVGFIKVILFAVAVGFIVQLILRLIAKPQKESEAGPLISDALKAAVIKKLNALKKKKMSARLEIIVYYNLFLSLMGYTEHSRHPSLPPDNYRENLEPVYPRIKKELEEVTRIFSDVFYGGIEVRSERLSQFRSAIRHIFRVILHP